MPLCIRLRGINDVGIGFLCGGSAAMKHVSIYSAIIMPVCSYDVNLELIISAYVYLGGFLRLFWTLFLTLSL